ncbi:MAG: J domain-containing protein [Methylococcaceae bacterium]|nr:J domain-containing protein [Methylococcaceae bacterium]MDZ4156413.1 J domain-containing protein [Methylococcales bacterium]MDP2391629.1 J domain-containing protein [Methylococcaceae bacterium]MDP3018128.1 J domain-containing protein [Methylococcaceae bacterium]MDP3389341.1 J domain-containing protein [Methylococcaceae bacterium]
MNKIHTHYDNLKVARNAPPEVIRAAYKTLSQKYHPDRNPGNTEAANIMKIINTSYEVLSDPERRLKHDVSIEKQEISDKYSNNRPDIITESISRRKSITDFSNDIYFHIRNNWLLFGFYLFLGYVLLIGTNEKTSQPLPRPKPYIESPIPEKPLYVRPKSAPNNHPWPASAGYIEGYKKLHTDGLSTVTVDNTQNDSDVFVKLVSLDSSHDYPIRQFYIPAFNNFSLTDIRAGNYDIRYRDLSNGGLSRSEAFNLKEISISNGKQFSSITMTLYKVHNGNMQTYELSETEF